MRKLLKILFSQTSIVILLLFVQVGLILLEILRLREYWVYINGVLFVITAIAVIYVVNSNKNPAYKLAWIIPMMLFPLFGGLFYLVIQGQSVTRGFFLRVKSIDKTFSGCLPADDALMDELRLCAPSRYGTANYLCRNEYVGYRAFKNTAVSYYPCGEAYWRDMLTELEKAEKYIFMEYFIIESGKMWDSILDVLTRKAAEGVDVRVLYDGVGSLVQLPRSYPKRLKELGINARVFIPLVPFLSTLQNNRDHRKITVIDGKVAFNGGINLADEYINRKQTLGYWKDSGVRLTGDAAYSFSVIFLQMWQLVQRSPIDPSGFRPEPQLIDNAYGYVMPYADAPNDDYQVGEFVYMDIINKAHDYVHITTPYLILDNEMMTALINAARSGVDIKIIIPGRADHWYAYYVAMDYARELIEQGVEIYAYTPGFIHAKNFVSDDEVAVVGSINLDYRSLYLHFECATWICQSPAVLDVAEDFNETLRLCRRLTVEEIDARPAWQRLVSAILRIFAPLM